MYIGIVEISFKNNLLASKIYTKVSNSKFQFVYFFLIFDLTLTQNNKINFKHFYGLTKKRIFNYPVLAL